MARGIPRYDMTPRASGNNNRLSTLWREVISLAGVARSLSKARRTETFSAETDTRNTMQIEKPGGSICKATTQLKSSRLLAWDQLEVALFPDAAAVLASAAGVLVEPGRIFHAAGRYLSSLESDVACS